MFDQERDQLNEALDEYGYDVESWFPAITSSQIDTDSGIIKPGQLINTTTRTTIKAFIINPGSVFRIGSEAIINNDKRRLISRDDSGVQKGTFVKFEDMVYKIVSSIHNHIYLSSELEEVGPDDEVVSS